MSFRSIKPTEFKGNSVQLIGYDWMLITAGKKGDYNMMTAAWGGIGFLWQKPVTFIYVRPNRYTYLFNEKYDDYTLTFFDKKYRDILNLCGTKSGRDIDKMNLPGLTPLETENGNIYFEEAKLMLECKKLYFEDIKPENFLNPNIDKHYPKKDYHRIYTGEIISVLEK
jgi:flavin reductase (DIM6/NTAB) family NADH-FMN oxidoreductase RutF